MAAGSMTGDQPASPGRTGMGSEPDTPDTYTGGSRARLVEGRIVDGEFSHLGDNAEEGGLGEQSARVRRVGVELADGRHVSALRWGEEEPEMVLLHGGAQNAHTWDTVLLAMGSQALAVDLPGHGLSSWRPDHAYTPWNLADDVAPALALLAPMARLVVAMSLGGMTAWALAARHPHLVQRLVVIDITPGVTPEGAQAIVSFTRGPERFSSFEDILERTVAHNPTRSRRSLYRGVLHNTHRLPDGQWAWRWDPQRAWTSEDGLDLTPLWDDVAACSMPMLLVRGSDSPVVSDADEARIRQTAPQARTLTVNGAGHSVQGDKPLALAEILTSELSIR